MQEPHSTEEPVNMNELHSGLEKVYEVSAFLDFPFTLDEVANYFLPRHNITAQELWSLISRGSFADIPFQVQNGYLLTRPTQSESSRLERERISAAKLDSATHFARLLSRLVPFIRTVSVTGSVAYGSAGKWDDIDLFVVTKENRLWLSVFMALALVRICKLLSIRPAHLLPFCLSYVHDERGFAEDSLRNQANPLFARELLRAKPVVGADQYRRILEENEWVGRVYARSYASKLRDLSPDIAMQLGGNHARRRGFSIFLDWAERIVFTFLSRYLGMRAYLTNLKLKSEGDQLRIFEPRITSSSCVYTSNFYRWLHALWGD